MKGPVECTVSQFLKPGITHLLQPTPRKGHTAGRSKSSQVHLAETEGSLFQLSATTLLPIRKGITQVSFALSSLLRAKKSHTYFLSGITDCKLSPVPMENF